MPQKQGERIVAAIFSLWVRELSGFTEPDLSYCAKQPPLFCTPSLPDMFSSPPSPPPVERTTSRTYSGGVAAPDICINNPYRRKMT